LLVSEEKRGRCEANLLYAGFMSKATSVPQANHALYSSPVEALNLIVESKSLIVESNNSTTELHLPIEAKKTLAIILFCGF